MDTRNEYAQSMTGRTSPAIELTEPLIEVVAERFRILGEPMRIRLLNELRDGELTVGQLQEATSGTQQNVSKHLGILHQAGMLERRKDGTQILYRISDPSVFELCEVVCDGMRRRVDELDSILRGTTS